MNKVHLYCLFIQTNLQNNKPFIKLITSADMASIDLSEAIKSKKGVLTSDREICGNIIGEREGSIIVEKGVIHEYIYRIPRSNIEAYDGAQIILNIPLSNLDSFEEKRDSSAESTTVDSKNTATQLKDSVTGTISGTVNKVKDLVSDNNDKS